MIQAEISRLGESLRNPESHSCDLLDVGSNVDVGDVGVNTRVGTLSAARPERHDPDQSVRRCRLQNERTSAVALFKKHIFNKHGDANDATISKWVRPTQTKNVGKRNSSRDFYISSDKELVCNGLYFLDLG